MGNTRIVFAGLPLSGKSTFIAALWYRIFHSYGNERYTVEVQKGAENDYLNQISAEWVGCDKVTRTTNAKVEEVTISFRDNNTGISITLNIPDIAGEYFSNQFESRQWTSHFDGILTGVDGLLVFVDPADENNMPKFIQQANDLYRIFDEKMLAETEATKWEPKLAPSQVKIVDFLQSFYYHKQKRRPVKVSVIVSRWDLVAETYKSKFAEPEYWCKSEMPLLHQYLENNADKFLTKYFGVSAQGGNYSNADIKTALMNMQPKDRIIVTHNSETSNDILQPIAWISNAD